MSVMLEEGRKAEMRRKREAVRGLLAARKKGLRIKKKTRKKTTGSNSLRQPCPLAPRHRERGIAMTVRNAWLAGLLMAVLSAGIAPAQNKKKGEAPTSPFASAQVPGKPGYSGKKNP